MESTRSTVLDSIPFAPDLAALKKRLRIKDGSESAAELSRMLEQAVPLARPKALVLEAYITGRGEDWVEIAGMRFSSRVLRVNMEQAHRVFPFLVTCGMELQDWAAGISDMLLQFWAEAIKESALVSAIRGLDQFLENRYHPGKTATMNPGSLQDWPIQQQQPLFALLGEGSRQIGVQLTESLLMVPSKTVSGIRFPTEVDFESCELCPRENCPGRRAPYNVTLYDVRHKDGFTTRHGDPHSITGP